MNEIKRPVGTIKFGKVNLNAYSSMYNPLFRATEVAKLIGYSENNLFAMLKMCNPEDKKILKMFTGGQRRDVTFITMNGIQDILIESRRPEARELRKGIVDELILSRKNSGLNIVEQFDKWNNSLNARGEL